MSADYQLQIPEDIERRINRCRASIRAALRERLRDIAVAAGRNRSRAKPSPPKEPALRFYVYEGYRVFYQLDLATRRVVVLDLGLSIS